MCQLSLGQNEQRLWITVSLKEKFQFHKGWEDVFNPSTSERFVF